MKLLVCVSVCLAIAVPALLLFVPGMHSDPYAAADKSVLAPSHAYADASCENLAEYFEDRVSFIARCGSPIPDSIAVHECKFPAEPNWATYLPAEPTIHYIDGGDFVALCVMPERYWFDVFLNAHSPGLMVIEIPKDAIDLRQFDFPHCLSPGHVWVRDDLNVPTKSVTISQIHETEHSRILQIAWDYSGVRMISYGGVHYGAGYDPYRTGYYADNDHPGQCINEYVSGGYDPSESIRHVSVGEVERYVCHDYGRFAMVDFVRNITTGSVESMCLDKYLLVFVLDVEDDGHLLLDIPHDVLLHGVSRTNAVGNYETFYSRPDRDFFSDATPFSAFTSEQDDSLKWYSGKSLGFTFSMYDKYGAYPVNQLKVVAHSFDEDSGTYRVPFLKEDVVFRLKIGDPGVIAEHVREKYAVPFTTAPPLVQSQLVPPEDVLCRDNLVLAFKPGATACHETANWIRDNSCSDIGGVNYTAVCVRPSSLEALAERGVLHAEIHPLR